MKKKSKKVYRKAKPTEFPKNSRFIPEFLTRISDEIYLLIGLFCLIVAILTIQADLYNNVKEVRKLEAEKVRVESEIVHWEKEVKKHPDYRDGYFSLALLYYQKKNFSEARKYLDKAMETDPNFGRGKELQRLMGY